MDKPSVYVYIEDGVVICACGGEAEFPDGRIDTRLDRPIRKTWDRGSRVEAVCPECGTPWRLAFVVSEVTPAAIGESK